MNTLNLKPLIAMLVMAAGVGATAAHAEGLRVAALTNPVDPGCHSSRADTAPDLIEPADEAGLAASIESAGAWSSLGHLDVGHVIRDPSGWILGGSAPQVEAGPQYAVTDRLSIGGEWEHFQPLRIDGHPNIREYTFGLRTAF